MKILEKTSSSKLCINMQFSKIMNEYPILIDFFNIIKLNNKLTKKLMLKNTYYSLLIPAIISIARFEIGYNNDGIFACTPRQIEIFSISQRALIKTIAHAISNPPDILTFALNPINSSCLRSNAMSGLSFINSILAQNMNPTHFTLQRLQRLHAFCFTQINYL